jgi:ATP-dependent helicase/nuclease subunit A
MENGVAEHGDLMRNWVTQTLASPLLARARRAPRVWRETPFCIIHEGEMVEGRIDLLFEEPDGNLVLADYKTDDVAPAELASAVKDYRPQLVMYREAVRQVAGRSSSEVFLWFVRVGEAVAVD